ncbi:hypothetical protein LENED_004240 [Lentinula edodes]|uniref:Uncharacterized protein n=1 Tax=Lentinula edodes TaxID=5353 RepID=A0A1Q3E5N3_LENED|nr:hypothetical protein LENED_004240 [Lentinula edodes]
MPKQLSCGQNFEHYAKFIRQISPPKAISATVRESPTKARARAIQKENPPTSPPSVNSSIPRAQPVIYEWTECFRDKMLGSWSCLEMRDTESDEETWQLTLFLNGSNDGDETRIV